MVRMMNLVRKSVLVLAAALPLGCFFDSGDEYPNLDKAALVGCWSDIRPLEGVCNERCFTSGGGQYYLHVSGLNQPGQENVGEHLGTYRVSGHVIVSTLTFANAAHPTDTSITNYEAGFTLRAGVLTEITPGGGRLSFPRSDSSRNCRPHWRVFKKPSDWDLD